MYVWPSFGSCGVVNGAMECVVHNRIAPPCYSIPPLHSIIIALSWLATVMGDTQERHDVSLLHALGWAGRCCSYRSIADQSSPTDGRRQWCYPLNLFTPPWWSSSWCGHPSMSWVWRLMAPHDRCNKAAAVPLHSNRSRMRHRCHSGKKRKTRPTIVSRLSSSSLWCMHNPWCGWW